ncbi:MAG: shikimate dehydrogenase [Legionellales bacterium]|nr:shikimate dehydrogenase [Legionellales bacterium]|tara:strand:+ start:644 stop:1441 length:798 start_codon:yes stop_codon:yes gene_type:complete
MMRFCVIGYPAKHSLSPQLHQAFACQVRLDICYTIVEVSPDLFETQIQALANEGYMGANITLPYKSRVLSIADSVSDNAQLARSANTLKFEDHRCFADTTDGVGFLKGYPQKNGWKSQTVLLLGAGGAACSIAAALASEGANVLVMARDAERQNEMLKKLNHPRILAFHASSHQGLDVVINATSASLLGELPDCLPESALLRNTVSIDVVYNLQQHTPFMQWSMSSGASSTLDGWNMLVEQGAQSFYWWTGYSVDTENFKKNRRV